MIMGRFKGENLESHDSAHYPSTVKFDPLFLHRGMRPREKVCNRALTPTIIFFTLVEPLSFGTVVFSPYGIFHVNPLAFVLFILYLQNHITN